MNMMKCLIDGRKFALGQYDLSQWSGIFFDKNGERILQVDNVPIQMKKKKGNMVIRIKLNATFIFY